MPILTFLTLAAQAVLILALPILIAALFQWLRQRATEFKSRLATQQQQFMEAAISMAVRAAEQSGASGQLVGGAQAKKAYAIKAAQEYLNRLGMELDVNGLATLLEAEVHKQFCSAAPVVDNAATRSALLDKAVQSAVLAAEQSALSSLIQNAGAQKKRFALDFAFKYLDEHGLRVDPTVVDGLLEAEIMRQKIGGAR